MNMKKKYNMPQTEEQSVNLCFSVMVSSTLGDEINGTDTPGGLIIGD